MLVPRNKKINLFFRLGLLLIVMVLASSATKNIIHQDVRAQDRPANRVNIVPGNVEVSAGQERVNWQAEGNVFFADLGEAADLPDFNRDNSVYLIDAPASSADKPTAADETGASFDTKSENSQSAGSADGVGGPSEAESDIIRAGLEAVTAGENTPDGTVASEVPPAPATTETGVTTEEPGPSPDEPPATPAADTTDGAPAEPAAELPRTTENYTERTLIFKDFNLPENIEINSITNAQLRLSLAGKSANPNDKLMIYYDLGGGWQEAGTIGLDDAISNKANQGYFLYGLPIFQSWSELGALKIKVSLLTARAATEEANVEAFIDAVWLEIDYAEEEIEAVPSEQSPEEPPPQENLDFSLDLVSVRTDFRPEENPDFNFLYKRNKSGLDALISTILSPFWDEYKNIGVTAAVKEKNGRVVSFDNEINYVSDGEFNVRFKRKPRQFKPGEYKLELTIADGDKTYTQVREFSWGVLAINVNKSIYLPGETANLQMAVLDDSGNTVCDADLFLEIIAPDGGVAFLDTANGLVRRNSECGPNNVITVPDYEAFYDLAGAGAYQLKLTARTANGSKSVSDQFEVRESVPFEVERIGPTRIYPWADYKMRLKIKAETDYEGEIRELLPVGFSLVSEQLIKNGIALVKNRDYGFKNRTESDESRSLAWQALSLKPGDSLEITYGFDAPNVSPEFYLLGPLRIGDFEEFRFWQIASDAIVSIDATGGSNVGWTNAARAWDSSNNTYGTRSIPNGGANDSANYLRASSNGASDLGGTITQVEIGFEGYAARTYVNAVFRPLFGGTATGTAQTILGTVFGTSDSGNTFYVDITNDALAPATWTWNDVINLDILLHGNNTGGTNRTMYVDQIRIRVTYNEPNTAPIGSFNSVAQKTDGSGAVDVSFDAADANTIDNVRAKIEYQAGDSCSFSSSSDPSLDTTDANTTAVFGDPKVDNNSAYQIGTTTGWIVTASGTNTVNFDWLSETDLPTADGIYCLRLTVNDLTVDGTSTTATTTLDNVAPSAPGAFTLATTSNGNEVRLTFGDSSTDSNFKEYKIFYKPGSAGVTESDLEFNRTFDANLGYDDYNGATSTTIDGLMSRTEYVFNIWAYDQFGNKASSTEVTITTGRAVPVRANSVSFLAGQYVSSDGATGQESDTDQTLDAFDFSLAETGAQIENAYVIFEIDFESYVNRTGDYTGYALAFDACEQPCTPNAFSGSGAVSVADNTVLAHDESESNMARLLLDVTDEAQLAAYDGGNVTLAGQIGYSIDRGTATNSISAAKAVLVVTYKYYEQQTGSYTNTVVYPLESTIAGDSGSRRAVQNDDCSVDTSGTTACPRFSYNLQIPEYASRLSQWFQTYNAVDGNATYDANINVNVEGTNIDSATYIHEAALGGTQGNTQLMYFSEVNGFAESTAQQLEYHATSPGATLTYYMVGGEAVETYTASTSAAVKTRTVSFPLGVINNGLTTTKSNSSVDVYFPENGIASGTVSIKKAWVRIISNNYNTGANTITASTRVGTRAETAGYAYAYNPSATDVKPSFNIIHVIPAADYAELESANASSSKTVTVYTQNSSAASQGGTSAELLITYTYTSESTGHLSSLNLYAGQSYIDGSSQLATSSGLHLILPEPPGTKTMLAGGLLASYLLSATDGTMPGANLTLDANLATGTPVCVNAYNSRPDSVNAFTEFYKNVFSSLSTVNRQTFSTCFSNDGGADATAGAKMNSSLIYTYKWEAPPAQLEQDNWRWYENLNSLDPVAPRAGEQTVIRNINIADVLRLRVNLGLTAEELPVSAEVFKLQFGTGTSCGAVASWTDVGTTTSAAVWRGFNNSAVADGSSTGNILLSTSDKFETYEENNPTSLNPRALEEGEYGEWDWVLYNNGASSTADYCFRMVKSDGSPLNNYASWPLLTTAASNTPPATPVWLNQTYSNGTTSIANQAWIRENQVRLVASTTDVNINEVIGLYFELIDNAGSFRTATSVPAGPCAFGTVYNSCASKIWLATSTAGDYRVSPFVGTTSITVLPQNYDGYKWQALACDDGGGCSNWTNFGANPNFRVDLTPPSPPGALTAGAKGPTSINLIFGATTTEANFLEYRIFYKKATSSVRETDNEWDDGNLDFIDFYGATTTLVNTLSAGSTYVFNIWAYDLAGNKASSTVELVASTTSSFTPPSGIISTISQRMDGTGALAFDITANDPDNDDTLRAKFEYEAGATCGFLSSGDPTLDPSDAKTTAVNGDPKVDNNSTYQLGTTTGWIMTSLGLNHVYFDWLSKSEIPNANGTYCVRMTLNDGLFDQATSSTKLILIDNLAPAVPGPLTLVSKHATGAVLRFGTSSNDTHFDRYRIFYATGTPVTIADYEQNDTNLQDIFYNSATTTSVSGLMPDTQYYFNIWAYDDYGNYASSTELAFKTNGLPYNASSTGQFRIDEMTPIANGAWTTQSEVRLHAAANDPDASEVLTLYFQFIPNASSFTTATTQPASACAWGTAYNSCSSKVWFVSTSTPGNYSVTPYSATTSITGIPDSSSGYKWQSIACDDEADCSVWSVYDLTAPNIRIDTTAPTPPGALTLSAKTSTSITLAFGSSTSEANFLTYRIFYATSSPVNASSSEHADSNLGYIDYFGASLTTIPDLTPNTQYFINIFAYDQAGQAASSTEMSVTTNQVQSTPGVMFYTRNTRVLYYKVWDGTAWGAEQSGPTLGSAAGDNIRQLASIRSDDGGKIAVLAKTWDATNQEWWGTVYKVAANTFATSTQLGTAYAGTVSNNLISGCMASLSGGEFFVVRNNNNANGTLVYSWNNATGWSGEVAGPNPIAVVNGCRLVRRPGTDNYLLTTFDNSSDLGSAYYDGGATYTNSWSVWTEHATAQYSTQNFVGDAFFDLSDNTRGAVNYSNSATNAYTYGKLFLADNTSLSYGAASTTPQTAPDNWGNTYVHGEFAADPGSAGLAYFAGRDINQELNVYKIDISGNQLAWGTVTNGDNISSGMLYTYANNAQKPFTIAFYKNTKGLVLWNLNTSSAPAYRKFDSTANSLDAASSTVPGPAADIWPRVRSYDDPNEDELLAIYQNDNVDYGAVFWSGASNQFYSSSNQAWTLLATSTGATNVNDEKFTFAFSGRNSAPNTPTSLAQLKNDASTTIDNGAWTTENSVYLRASASDPDTSEVITLYVQLIANGSSFTSSTTQPTGACVWGTAYGDCASKIWFVASSSLGDYSSAPFTDAVNITGLPESSTGYKWQVLACDDSAACANWVKFNLTQPNFRVDTTAPTAPGSLTVLSKTSQSITLQFGATTTETNFLEYRVYYKQGASGVTEGDTQHADSDFTNINFNGTTNTTVINLASSTQYVFNIWAYDQAGNKASSTSEVATTTNASALLTQRSYLLENDDGANVNANTADVTASTSLTGVQLGERINARIQLDNTGGDVQSNTVYKLQFENQTDAPGTWTDVGVATQISYSLGLSGSNGDGVTSTKATANPRTWTNGSWHEGVNVTGSHTLTNGYYTEFVFAVKTGGALAGKTYRLRLYNNTDNRPLNLYNNYPTISTVASGSKRYSKAAVASLPTTNSDLTYYFDPEGYADALADDNANRDDLVSTANIPVVNFFEKNSTSSQAVTASWNGQSSIAAGTAALYLQVYRFGSVNAWVTVASNTSAAANTDFTLSGSINSKLSEYYDGSAWTYWRVYQASGSETLRSDYFTVSYSAPVPVVSQDHYRWRTDNGSQTTASWLEAEDVGSPTASTTLVKGQNIRLRLAAANTGGGAAANYTYRLEYASTTANCATDPGGWVAVPTNNTQHFRMATTTNFGNGSSTTAQLNNSEGYTFVAGKMVKDPSNTTGSTTLAESQYTENEFVFYATTNAGDGRTYCFRATNAGSALNSYGEYAELTLAGNPNTVPALTVNPSDNGSATNSPTNFGSNVAFTATADDPENDDYYLAICRTNGITAGNAGPPTCNGGSWCVSARASTTIEASCNYSAATSSEVLNWYGFVCDHRAGVGVAKCSVASQGGWGDDNDSPFNVNHQPVFTNIATQNNNQDPGATFNITSTSSDVDTVGGADTLYYYVCRTNSASFSGCTLGAGDTVCEATATSSPNARCSFTDTAPTPSGAYTYYGFLYDNHGFAASTNPRSSSYSINNVPPVIDNLTLNSGLEIVLNIKGAPDKEVQTISTSVEDQNGCATGLVSATAVIYMSNATSGPSCTANDNDCYQINTSNCVKSACTDDNDSLATYTCSANFKYFADPTDLDSGWESYNWLSRLQVYDGYNYDATTSAAVELKTAQALDVVEPLIDFGSNMYVGDNSGTTNQPTTIVNIGNAPLDTDLSGTDMAGNPSGNIPVTYLEWSQVSGFNWSSGNDLTSGGQTVDTILPKPTSVGTTSDFIYWGIGIPLGADPSEYTGQNTFTATIDPDNW
jgi:hypothetical protein